MKSRQLSKLDNILQSSKGEAFFRKLAMEYWLLEQAKEFCPSSVVSTREYGP